MKYQFGKTSARVLHLAVKAMELSGEKDPLLRLNSLAGNPPGYRRWPHDPNFVVIFYPSEGRTVPFYVTVELSCQGHQGSQHNFELAEIGITRGWEQGDSYDFWTFTENEQGLVLTEQGSHRPDE